MDFTRLFDTLSYQLAKYPQQVSMAHHLHDKDWAQLSTTDCYQICQSWSHVLLASGCKAGDRVLIFCEFGTAFWMLADIAILQIGCVSVPIYPTVRDNELDYILTETCATAVIVGNVALFEKIKLAITKKPCLFFGWERIAGVVALPLKDIPLLDEAQKAQLSAQRNAINEHDVATIVYTSGTTSDPKGVVLSHRNIVSNIKACIIMIPIHQGHRALSALPLSHIFERMVVYAYVAVGASIYFVPAVNSLELVRQVRPHYMTAVPKLLERFYTAILAKADRSGWFARKTVRWAVGLGKRFSSHIDFNFTYLMQLWLADILVFRLWRGALGGKLRGIMVGAAALPPELGRLFSAARIAIREGYGLSETSPVVAFNRFEPGGNRFGTVGMPIPGVEIRIVARNDDGAGEIQVKGPNVMRGYYQNAELTAQVLSTDGWFTTGDIGKMVHGRFLKITGRSKEIFKTLHGRYVSPTQIEQHIEASEYVEQCMVVGANKTAILALIVPNFQALEQWCRTHKIHWTAPQFMVVNTKVEQFMASIVLEYNKTLQSHERVRKWILLHEPWTIESGELTPTLKIKRNVIETRWQKHIEEQYTEDETDRRE